MGGGNYNFTEHNQAQVTELGMQSHSSWRTTIIKATLLPEMKNSQTVQVRLMKAASL